MFGIINLSKIQKIDKNTSINCVFLMLFCPFTEINISLDYGPALARYK